MSGIAAFIGARLDEDEAVARAAKHSASGVWTYIDPHITPHPTLDRFKVVDSLGYSLVEGYDIDSQPWWACEHIARWDPARILAEVAAKRRMLVAHQTGSATQYHCRNNDHLQDWQCRRAGCRADVWPYCELGDYDNDPTACRGLLILAEPYADHAEFNHEWRLP